MRMFQLPSSHARPSFYTCSSTVSILHTLSSYPPAPSFSYGPQPWPLSSSFLRWTRKRSTSTDATCELLPGHPQGRESKNKPAPCTELKWPLICMTLHVHHHGTISRAGRHKNTADATWAQGSLAIFPFISTRIGCGSIMDGALVCRHVALSWVFHVYHPLGDSLVSQMVKNLPAMQETWVWSLGWEDPLEKEMATHSSILACIIPWTEEPGGL